MKKATKILALLVAVVMVAGVLCGCGGSKKAREAGKYTYWSTVDGAVAQTQSGYADLLMYQEMSKRTGIEVNFIHPTAGSTGSEAFQILLTSADMPDMIEYGWKSYPGGADAAINNKVIISLNNYLKDYAPNYYEYMEGSKNEANNGLYKAQAMTQGGNYYGFGNLSIGTYRTFGGLVLRKDLLDKWGLDVPVTIDDWTEVFATAKSNGIKYPLTGQSNLFAIGGNDLFNGAWGVGKLYHLEGDKVVLSVDTPEYKEYVKTMAGWMKKGYIDPDYITNGSDVMLANMTSGKSIATFCYVGSGMGKMIPAMENSTEFPDYDLVACPYPVLNEGEQNGFQYVAAEAADASIAISTSCGLKDEERYKEAIKWCDYLYSEEGKELKIFGVEGKTFTKTEKAEVGEDGEKYTYTYTDVIFDREKQESIGAHSVEAALYHFMRPANAPGLNQHSDYLYGFYPYESQKHAIVLWNEHVELARKCEYPAVTYTNEETARNNELTSKASDTLNAAISNIILGKADISTYDAAVAKAKKDGYDEMLKIRQDAYDRYVSKTSK